MTEDLIVVNACKKVEYRSSVKRIFVMNEIQSGFIRRGIELAVQQFYDSGKSRVNFNIQLHDESQSPCFRIDASYDQPEGEIPLIPDPYALATKGYINLQYKFGALPPWEQRLQIAIWRGSTTGMKGINMEGSEN